MNELVAKWENGEDLTETELWGLTMFSKKDIELGKGRWTQSMQSIIQVNDDLFLAVNWEKGLTETQENMFLSQPYRVEPVERQLTITDWVEV